MLKESEWQTMNKVLLDIYDIQTAGEYVERLLRLCRMLIPYSEGCVLVFNQDMKIDQELSSSLDMTPDVFQDYLQNYYNKDYMKYLLDVSNYTMIYKDTDLMDEELRKKTDFYRDFLKPNQIPYGAGIVMRRYTKMIGIIHFFRTEKVGDFSARDMYFLDVLKNHITHALYRLLEQDRLMVTESVGRMQQVSARYGLTVREEEILECLEAGLSNVDIAKEKHISVSTVKKHIFHIYKKLDINTRHQIASVILKEEEVGSKKVL